MTKAQMVLIGFIVILVGSIYMLFRTNKNALETKTADRFAGSEAVFLMNKLYEQGICINYTGEEIAEVYKGKTIEERKVLQAYTSGNWKCK